MNTENTTNQQPPRRKQTVSERQFRANQANAQKSSGPRTGLGKSVSKYNSLKHGLTSFMVCLPGEDKQMYEDMRADIHATFQPTNLVTFAMCDNLMSIQWRILRLARTENCLIREKMLYLRPQNAKTYDQLSIDVETSLAFKALSDDSRTLDRLDRYEGRLQRQHLRLLKQLMDLRNDPAAPVAPSAPEIHQNENCQSEPIPKNEHLSAPDPAPIGNATTPNTVSLRPPATETHHSQPLAIAVGQSLAPRHSPLH